MLGPLPRRLIYGAVFLVWLLTMSILIYRHYRPFHAAQEISTAFVLPEELFGDQWMGVYFKGVKVGHCKRQFEKTASGYRMSETLDLDMKIMDAVKKVQTETEVLLSKDLSLISFHADLKGETGIKVSGEISGGDLRVTIEAAGGRVMRTIPMKQRPSLNLSLVPQVIKGGIKPGKRFSIPVIDPASLSQEIVPVEVSGKERILISGEAKEAYRLKGSLKSADFYVWVTETGEILKEESPVGFTLLREKKEEALRKGTAAPDLTAQAAVPFNMKLPDDIRYLKIRLSGINLDEFHLDGGRQHRVGNSIEIRREDLDALSIQKLASSEKEKARPSPEYIRDTAFVQSKDKQIIALSRKIVGTEKDPLKASRLIYNWVYTNVEKAPALTVPMAAEVLKAKKGDCNEHTVLFTALARASGIPARMSLGLVYDEGKFYYHAWPEIFAGDWVAVDPTLGQFPADAAHIRLITGDLDQQMRLAGVMGKIKIEGIEYR
jgi:hypothetical protein